MPPRTFMSVAGVGWWISTIPGSEEFGTTRLTKDGRLSHSLNVTISSYAGHSR